MPFTISHAPIAAPLWPLVRRGHLPLPALAIGAMVPDFEYFLHLRPLALWGHSLAGILTFCLPAGLVVVGAWEFVMRDGVRSLLAIEDTPAETVRSGRWWVLAGVAVLLGAASHIAWDGLTHRGGWGERMLPDLSSAAIPMRGRPVTWAGLLDYASTIVGGVIVCTWLGRQLHRAGALAVLARSGWRWLVLVATVGGALAVGYWNGSRGPAAADYWSGELWLARVAVGSMLGFAAALLAFCAIRRVARSRASPPAI
jgi:hypothetical protein